MRSPLPSPLVVRWSLFTPRFIRLARVAFAFTAATLFARSAGRELPPGPDQLFGELFADVQRAHVFADQKTFADAVPRKSVTVILDEYAAAKRAAEGKPDLEAFVTDRFLVPEQPASNTTARIEPIEQHLARLWHTLRRNPDRPVPGSSLLPLPHPYVVPGGRFREIYYWDSYFTMLGLRESGDVDLIESMADNFAYLIETYGLIPNGNRTYYLSRSQPPFFALMVELLAKIRGPAMYQRYRAALRAEYDYWCDRTWPTHHTVTLPDGSRLSRYYDQRETPRPEAFAHDEAVAARRPNDAAATYRHLRSAAESGWDFSSRWFEDGRTLDSIHTTDLVPVDLNALLCQLERTLARASGDAGEQDESARYAKAAEDRARALRQYCWSPGASFFCDYDLTRKQPSPTLTLAAVAPLFVRIATPEQAAAVRQTLETRFLRPGGLVTTLAKTGQQWDAPNGWAPLQWMAVVGLRNYRHDALAQEIARRWVTLNHRVYEATGRMMEKYDVEDLTRPAGGGEYPGQDGFGWTNGVYLALRALYPRGVLEHAPEHDR